LGVRFGKFSDSPCHNSGAERSSYGKKGEATCIAGPEGAGGSFATVFLEVGSLSVARGRSGGFRRIPHLRGWAPVRTGARGNGVDSRRQVHDGHRRATP